MELNITMVTLYASRLLLCHPQFLFCLFSSPHHVPVPVMPSLLLLNYSCCDTAPAPTFLLVMSLLLLYPQVAQLSSHAVARHARTRLPIYYIIILRLATLSEIFNQIKIHTFKTSIETKNITTNTENKLNTNELRYIS